MVARILLECGVDLGPREDLLEPNKGNREGYWENRRFNEVNDRLLDRLGGGWDVPPKLDDGWENSEELLELKELARRLVAEFPTDRPWGWKDPRTSLTLPFWRQVAPGLKVVVCVRDPLEVSHSLSRRDSSSEAFGLGLWLAYNRTILESTSADERIVTHYDSYFADPEPEIGRLVNELELPVKGVAAARAAATVNPRVRHERQNGRVQLPAEVAACYEELRKSVGGATKRAVLSSSDEQLAAVRSLLDEARVELEKLRPESELKEQLQREVGTLRNELEWRKGVMEHQAEQLRHRDERIEVLQNSRSLRYTAPLRRLAAVVRRH